MLRVASIPRDSTPRGFGGGRSYNSGIMTALESQAHRQGRAGTPELWRRIRAARSRARMVVHYAHHRPLLAINTSPAVDHPPRSRITGRIGPTRSCRASASTTTSRCSPTLTSGPRCKRPRISCSDDPARRSASRWRIHHRRFGHTASDDGDSDSHDASPAVVGNFWAFLYQLQIGLFNYASRFHRHLRRRSR